MGPLNSAKEEMFVQRLLAGDSQRVAYRASFPKSKTWKDSTVDNNAYVLAKKPEVLARLNYLKEQSASEKILDRRQRMELLSDIANNVAEKARDRISAVDILNKMGGEYVKRVEATVTADTTEIASKVHGILAEIASGDGA